MRQEKLHLHQYKLKWDIYTNKFLNLQLSWAILTVIVLFGAHRRYCGWIQSYYPKWRISDSLLYWKPLEDLHHSDHFPIICNFVTLPRQHQEIRKKWKHENADWANFSNEIHLLVELYQAPIDELVEHITNEIVVAADKKIPSTTIKPKKKCSVVELKCWTSH